MFFRYLIDVFVFVFMKVMMCVLASARLSSPVCVLVHAQVLVFACLVIVYVCSIKSIRVLCVLF